MFKKTVLILIISFFLLSCESNLTKEEYHSIYLEHSLKMADQIKVIYSSDLPLHERDSLRMEAYADYFYAMSKYKIYGIAATKEYADECAKWAEILDKIADDIMNEGVDIEISKYDALLKDIQNRYNFSDIISKNRQLLYELDELGVIVIYNSEYDMI